MKKFIIPIALILFVSCSEKRKRPQMPVALVKIAPVIEQNVASVQDYVGRVYADRTVALKARVDGVLEQKLFRDGQKVKKDDLLFVIEKDTYLAKTKQAEARADSAKAKAELSLAVFKRMSILYKKQAVSRQEVDQAKADNGMARADYKSAMAALDEAKLQLKWTEIRAPFDGRTGVTSISVGNMVGPGSDVLMTVTKSDQVKVEFSLNEKHLINIVQKRQAGQTEDEGAQGIVPELILSNGSTYPHKGKVIFWDNRINPATGTLKLRALFSNPQNLLGDGMYVRLKLTLDDAKPTLLIPQSAIQKDQAGAYVLTYDKAAGTANIRRIETAGTHGVWSIVTKGLKKGEKIVVQGLQKVTPGKKIQIDPANGDK